MSDDVFKRGSKTYYHSSKFFPKNIRDKVTVFYTFVRIVDDFVDKQPPDKKNFLLWKNAWKQSWKGKPSGIQDIDEFINLAKQKHVKKQWIESFFDSMSFDLQGKNCTSMKQTLRYIYGSAEVIGYVMASLMDLPGKSRRHAALLGRAMQYINFIRDIKEDNELGRRYLPTHISLQPTTKKQEKEFIEFLQEQIALYRKWDDESRKGFGYIPYRFRVAVMTAADMYRWTAKKIYADPLLVFKKKIKPTKRRIFLTGLKNMVKAIWT